MISYRLLYLSPLLTLLCSSSWGATASLRLSALQQKFEACHSLTACQVELSEFKDQRGKVEFDKGSEFDAVFDQTNTFSRSGSLSSLRYYGSDGEIEWLAADSYLAVADRGPLANFGEVRQGALNYWLSELSINLLRLKYLRSALSAPSQTNLDSNDSTFSFSFITTNLNKSLNTNVCEIKYLLVTNIASVTIAPAATDTLPYSGNLYNWTYVFSDFREHPTEHCLQPRAIEVKVFAPQGNSLIRAKIAFYEDSFSRKDLFTPPVESVRDPFTEEKLPIGLIFDARISPLRCSIVNPSGKFTILPFPQACLTESPVEWRIKSPLKSKKR